MAADPALVSNLAGFIFIIGGILLTLGLRWYFLKEGGMKFNAPIMTFGIVEMVIALVVALVA
jgi:uncharacterized protein with PQ loop repeat